MCPTCSAVRVAGRRAQSSMQKPSTRRSRSTGAAVDAIGRTRRGVACQRSTKHASAESRGIECTSSSSGGAPNGTANVRRSASRRARHENGSAESGPRKSACTVRHRRRGETRVSRATALNTDRVRSKGGARSRSAGAACGRRPTTRKFRPQPLSAAWSCHASAENTSAVTAAGSRCMSLAIARIFSGRVPGGDKDGRAGVVLSGSSREKIFPSRDYTKPRAGQLARPQREPAHLRF